MHPVRGQSCRGYCWYIFFVCLKDFEANEDLDSIVEHSLSTYEEARYIRLIPTGYTWWPCVRVEIYVIS